MFLTERQLLIILVLCATCGTAIGFLLLHRDRLAQQQRQAWVREQRVFAEETVRALEERVSALERGAGPTAGGAGRWPALSERIERLETQRSLAPVSAVSGVLADLNRRVDELSRELDRTRRALPSPPAVGVPSVDGPEKR